MLGIIGAIGFGFCVAEQSPENQHSDKGQYHDHHIFCLPYLFPAYGWVRSIVREPGLIPNGLNMERAQRAKRRPGSQVLFEPGV